MKMTPSSVRVVAHSKDRAHVTRHAPSTTLTTVRETCALNTQIKMEEDFKSAWELSQPLQARRKTEIYTAYQGNGFGFPPLKTIV